MISRRNDGEGIAVREALVEGVGRTQPACVGALVRCEEFVFADLGAVVGGVDREVDEKGTESHVPDDDVVDGCEEFRSEFRANAVLQFGVVLFDDVFPSNAAEFEIVAS